MFATEQTRRRRFHGALLGAALAVVALGLPALRAGRHLDHCGNRRPDRPRPDHLQQWRAERLVSNLAYAALIWRAPDGTAKAGLATDWKYSDDRLSFVMNLRAGVKFSDGSPMTAADVANWLKHYKEKGSFTRLARQCQRHFRDRSAAGDAEAFDARSDAALWPRPGRHGRRRGWPGRARQA